MTGIAAVIVKIMPDAPNINLKEIEKSAQSALEKEGAKNLSFKEDPIAYGISAIEIKFAWPEEKSTDIIDNTLAKIKHVSSVKIEDYRRAFG